MGLPLNGEFLTAADDGELERRTDKWAHKLIQERHGPVGRIVAKASAGRPLSEQESAKLAAVISIYDAAEAIKARIPADRARRRAFKPHLQPDWPA